MLILESRMYKLVDDLRLGRNLHFDVEYNSSKPASQSVFEVSKRQPGLFLNLDGREFKIWK